MLGTIFKPLNSTNFALINVHQHCLFIISGNKGNLKIIGTLTKSEMKRWTRITEAEVAQKKKENRKEL